MILARCLGPPDLSMDGGEAPRELLWRKNLALLVYLARSRDRTRDRTHLAGLLWGGSTDEAARHSLNEALRVLRRRGGESLVISDGRKVTLDAGQLRLDVELLEERLDAGDCMGAADLVRGEFLEGLDVPDASRFEDWLAAERSYWRRRSVEALAARAEALGDAGDPAGGLRSATRALELDPCSDAAARAAMRATALAGERAAALDLYESFADRLEKELRTRPEAETVRLAERVRLERSWKLPEEVTPAAGRGPRLVGREEEMAAVLEVWRAARDGSPAGLVVAGVPGVGKSRLLEELASRARLDGAVVLAARSVPGDRDVPEAALRALAVGGLLDAPGLVAAPPAALAGLARVAPGWGERFHEEVGGAEPLPLGAAIVAVLATAADEQPVLLVLDDAQWLDNASLAAVERLLLDAGDRAVVVAVGSTEAGDGRRLDRLRARLGREIPGRTLRLAPLEPDDLAELARQVVPGYRGAALDRLVRRLAADSAGLPVLAQAILQALRLGLELGDLEGGAWPHEDRTLDETLPGQLPDSVVAAVRVGFHGLTPGAREVLAAASALDDRCEPAALAEVTGLGTQPLEAALAELEWARWLESEPRGYSFVARIVRRIVAEDMLTPGQRRRILERASAAGG